MPSIRKLLIANRGEIACRIIRTARRMQIETVLAVSEADRRSLAASQADEVVLIGPPPATDSYLRADRIIAAARQTGCDAIHPGYGFLSESAAFVEAVETAGLIFVGPSAGSMLKVGGKTAAKALATACGVPVVPGYAGPAQDAATLKAEAKSIGYPVLIKAVNGGGGRGMRLVEREADMADALDSAKREAKAAFGSDLVLLERLIVRPRHVEVQVFGDATGNVVHLFERDCSLQRRNQKVIEEAPAPGMSEGLRNRITSAAVAIAKAAGYRNAGTVEFLVEGGTLAPDAPWFFIEMNTRLQVEHPVTEAITGLDLVEWQLRIAAGETLPLRQDEIRISGHAIEVRINAEDPAKDFLPSIGDLVSCLVPTVGTGLRLEAGFRSGDTISPYYDSLLAKVIAHERTRAAAIATLARTLEHSCDIAGPRTNVGFVHALLTHPAVGAGTMDTGLIGREITALTRSLVTTAEIEAAAECFLGTEADNLAGLRESPWAAGDGFSLGPERRMQVTLLVDSTARVFDVHWPAGTRWPTARLENGATGTSQANRGFRQFHTDGRSVLLFGTDQIEIARPVHDLDADDGAAADTVRAPINGRVAKVLVKAGESTAKGARIAIIEAMKMEHVLTAPRDGTIAKVTASEGEQVAAGALIAVLDA